MPEYPQLIHLSVPELIGAAGGDPWHVNDTIRAGAPGEISELAQSFYNAGVSMTQTSDEFAAAKKRFTAAWDRDDPAHPINDSVEVQRATQVMQLNKEALTRVGVDLQNIAASLAEAQRSGHVSISGLNSRLVQIDNTIAAEIQKAQADGVQLDWSALKTAAINEVKGRLGEMNAVRNAYGNQLTTSRMEMAAEGYASEPVNGAVPNLAAPQPNGKPGSQPADLDEALNQIAGAPVPAAAVPSKPPPMDPKDIEAFKATAWEMLQRSGVPPERIESRLNEIVAQAQRGLGPSYRAPEPPRQPPPGFGEGFADRWFSTEQGIKNLLGQGGPGAPGVVESWAGLLKGTAETAVNPAGAAVEEIKNALNSPSPAYYLGEKTFDIGSTAATLPFGGEGAAVRAGLPVRTIAEGGAPEALVRGWNPTGGIPWDDFGTRFGAPGSRIWPEDNGFPAGYEPQPAQLPAGTVIDRFGGEGGQYLAPNLTPFADRALAPESVGSGYHRYEVTGEPLPPGWQIVQGPVEPWYGQTPSPGAVQYRIVGPDGVKVSVEALKKAGVLVDYGPVLGYEVP
jgi:Tuberculosis necrotizing toxin